jgi:hypothetical protein
MRNSKRQLSDEFDHFLSLTLGRSGRSDNVSIAFCEEQFCCMLKFGKSKLENLVLLTCSTGQCSSNNVGARREEDAPLPISARKIFLKEAKRSWIDVIEHKEPIDGS